ncbi:MAG: hypothetical protein IJC88_00385 [Oscillospiraceae bacterium]|nr:hypothetical protein [Oscillospiraceae bacterium]
MKNAVKYIVLSIASMVCMLVVLVITGLIVGVSPQATPAYMIVPTLGHVALFAAMVLFTVWSFRFSDGKPHQKHLIVSVCVLALSLTLYGVSTLLSV